MAQQAYPLLAALASHTGTSSSPSYPTSSPALCLLTGKAGLGCPKSLGTAPFQGIYIYSSSLHIMTQFFFSVTYENSPVYFRPSVSYLKYIMQCKCYEHGCYIILLRQLQEGNHIYMFCNDTVLNKHLELLLAEPKDCQYKRSTGKMYARTLTIFSLLVSNVFICINSVTQHANPNPE